MKHTKKLVSVLLALAMVFVLSVSALAVDNSVTVVIQQEPHGASSPSFVAATEVSLSGMASPTVYDVINNMSNVSIVSSGSDYTWKTVDILDPTTWEPTGDQGKVLNSLTFTDDNDDTYVWTNNGSSVVDETGIHGTYSGTAWVYVVNDVSPDTYMDSCSVSSGDTIYLNYQYSSFTW